MAHKIYKNSIKIIWNLEVYKNFFWAHKSALFGNFTGFEGNSNWKKMIKHHGNAVHAFWGFEPMSNYLNLTRVAQVLHQVICNIPWYAKNLKSFLTALIPLTHPKISISNESNCFKQKDKTKNPLFRIVILHKPDKNFSLKIRSQSRTTTNAWVMFLWNTQKFQFLKWILETFIELFNLRFIQYFMLYVIDKYKSQLFYKLLDEIEVSFTTHNAL